MSQQGKCNIHAYVCQFDVKAITWKHTHLSRCNWSIAIYYWTSNQWMRDICTKLCTKFNTWTFIQLLKGEIDIQTVYEFFRCLGKPITQTLLDYNTPVTPMRPKQDEH